MISSHGNGIVISRHCVVGKTINPLSIKGFSPNLHMLEFLTPKIKHVLVKGA